MSDVKSRAEFIPGVRICVSILLRKLFMKAYKMTKTAVFCSKMDFLSPGETSGVQTIRDDLAHMCL